MKNILGIKKLVKENENFRKVVFTGKQAQVVVMNLMPGDEIGEETHPAIDQLFFVTDGRGEVELDGKATPVEGDDLPIVPAGVHMPQKVQEVSSTQSMWLAPATVTSRAGAGAAW